MDVEQVPQRPAGGRLAGKIALVVGAGSAAPGWSNGSAVAAMFAREGAYSVAKAALHHLTRYIAMQYVRQRIRCKAIVPGHIDTATIRHRIVDTYGEPPPHQGDRKRLSNFHDIEFDSAGWNEGIMLRRRIVTSLFAFSVLALAASPSLGQSTTPYKIGMTYPLTGPQAAVIAEYVPAAELAIADVNRHGGVNGHPLQLVTEDSQGSPQGGVAAMRKLVQLDGVQAIMTIYTNVVTAQIPLAEELKVPIIAPVQAPGLMTRAQFGFAHAVAFPDVAPVVIKYWSNVHAKRVFALLSNNAFGQGVSPAARSAAQAAGADYNEAFADLDGTDFRGLLTRLKDYGPDQILVTLQGSPAEGAIIKQVRELGITAPILNPSNLYQSKVWRAGVGPYAEEMLFAGFYVNPAISGDFIRAFRARVGSDPGFDAAMIYDQVHMYAYAIGKAGYNGERIRNVLTTLQGVPSALGGTITMKPDHYTQMTSIGLWQVKGGKLTPVIAPKR